MQFYRGRTSAPKLKTALFSQDDTTFLLKSITRIAKLWLGRSDFCLSNRSIYSLIFVTLLKTFKSLSLFFPFFLTIYFSRFLFPFCLKSTVPDNGFSSAEGDEISYKKNSICPPLKGKFWIYNRPIRHTLTQTIAAGTWWACENSRFWKCSFCLLFLWHANFLVYH